MTVASTARTQRFTLDGVTAAFTFTFRAITANPTDIKCIATISGTDSTLTYTTQYTVSVDTDGVGGTVTLVSPSTIGSGTLTVYRDTTNLQSSDYDDYNNFPADTLETDLDIRTLVSQEQLETINRAIVLPISYSGTASTTLPTPVASQILGWNSSANAIINYVINSAAYLVLATQAQAEAGTDNTTFMSPLRTAQGIAALSPVTTSNTVTLTNKRITSRVFATTSTTSATIDIDSYDCYELTALAAATTFNAPTGTPTNFQKLIIRIKDNAGARALTWNAAFAAGGSALPSTTVLSKILTLGFIYNTANSLNKWQLVASAQET